MQFSESLQEHTKHHAAEQSHWQSVDNCHQSSTQECPNFSLQHYVMMQLLISGYYGLTWQRSLVYGSLLAAAAKQVTPFRLLRCQGGQWKYAQLRHFAGLPRAEPLEQQQRQQQFEAAAPSIRCSTCQAIQELQVCVDWFNAEVCDCETSTIAIEPLSTA